jgi:hypothetical protein
MVALLGATVAPAPVAAVSRVPKVAVIVGPVGTLTNMYRSLGDEAARAARAAGAQVVTVYTPNATWPAVKSAVTGASIVVYLGHGNGWPSPYRNGLYPPSQNGFGLNPVAGGDDTSHQYFGEAAVGKLKFAPNAVVILSHLCYASGNSEPGLVEGTTTQAIARVDNYAAGFIRAGAKAVVAEAYLGPAYYVKAILKARGSIESIWSASPTANGRHPIVGNSVRTQGYKYHLDPEHASSGFVRSLVSRGLTAAEVRAGASGTTGGGGVVAPPVTPSLTSAGVRFNEPSFGALPIANTGTRLTIPMAAGKVAQLPQGIQVSVRWSPVLLDGPPAPAPSQAPAVAPVPTVDPDAIARFERPNAPTRPAPQAPDIDLVVPEQNATVVQPVVARRAATGLVLRQVTYPAAPGLYRLAVTLHTPEGVAYDAATQDLLTPVFVRVGGAMAVAYGAPSVLTMNAGAEVDVPVRVLNAGSVRWDKLLEPQPAPVVVDGQATVPATTRPSFLVATWVSGDGSVVPGPLSVVLDSAVATPGKEASALLHALAPAVPGNYLLVLDVLVPGNGPLSASGAAPAIIRVTVNPTAATVTPQVTAAPAPLVTASPAPSPTPVSPAQQDNG